MKIEEIITRILAIYPALSKNKNWGERGLFYNPGNQFKLGAYVLTFKEKDGKNDFSSKIDRGNIYRLNLKISRNTFEKLFGPVPKRPLAGGVINTGHNFEKLNELMPHPIYGWMTWICVLNPSEQTINMMESNGLFDEAYTAAVATISKKTKDKENL